MFRYLTVFISLVWLISVVPAHANERIALVIGNGAYHNRPLNNPTNDAGDIAAVLRQLGFNVTLETDANQATMEMAIQSFGNQLHSGAVGLFYYAGHGIQYNGDNYIIPIGAMKTDLVPEQIKYKAVNVGYVLGMMQANNRLNIVILDACRDNPFRSFSRSLNRGLTRITAGGIEGTLIAYATSPGKTSKDGLGRNSPYTKHLLQFMPQPNLPIERMLKKVRAAVKQETNGQQTPWYEASIDGDFYFVEPHTIRQAEIADIRKVYPAINQGNCLSWQSPEMKANGGVDAWDSFYPKEGDMGTIVDEMSHCRSKDKIYLLKIDRYYVPIGYDGIRIKYGLSEK